MNAIREQIYQFLLDEIAQGRYVPDERIPTEQELCRMFSTHRLNAHYAVRRLQEHGILRRNRKQGTFVSRVPAPYLMGQLKSQVTRRICIINTTPMAFQHIHWNQRLVAPLESGLSQAGIEVLFENISSIKTADAYRSFLADLIERGFNALLLIPEYSSQRQSPISSQPQLLFEFHNNVFIFDRGVHHWNSWPYNIVSINVFGEGEMVARHLANRDIRHVVFCHGVAKEQPLWLTERLNGLQYGMSREVQEGQQLQVCEFDPCRNSPTFFRKIRELLKTGTVAVVAQNDEFAAAIIDQAASHGLHAGQDFFVIGFDDNVKYQDYNLTTVSPGLERIGSCLAAMISRSLDHGDDYDITCTKVHSQLKIRATG
jgi:GntR family transcriptional regulator of arabinose operon